MNTYYSPHALKDFFFILKLLVGLIAAPAGTMHSKFYREMQLTRRKKNISKFGNPLGFASAFLTDDAL
jgi:hypothetical protein